MFANTGDAKRLYLCADRVHQVVIWEGGCGNFALDLRVIYDRMGAETSAEKPECDHVEEENIPVKVTVFATGWIYDMLRWKIDGLSE